MDGDLKKGEKKKLHKKLRHPKGEHKKNHQGKARSHKHMDGVRHHMADGHSPKKLIPVRVLAAILVHRMLHHVNSEWNLPVSKGT